MNLSSWPPRDFMDRMIHLSVGQAEKKKVGSLTDSSAQQAQQQSDQENYRWLVGFIK